MRDFPADVIVEPVAYCNLSCSHCPQRYVAERRMRGVMDMATFHPIVDEIAWRKDVRLWLGFMGEPLLRPGRVKDMVRRATNAGCRVHLSTNGTLMTPDLGAWLLESGIEEIDVGVYSYNPETERNLKALLQRRLPGDPRVVAQMIVGPCESAYEVGEVESFKKRWLSRGATVKVRVQCSWGGMLDRGFILPEKRGACCWLARCAILLWDGRYAMCDGDWTGEFAVTASSISEAWSGSSHALIRQLQESGVYRHPLCNRCDDWATPRAQWFYPSDADRRAEDA